MKQLFVILLIISSISTSFACSCVRPNFTDADALRAVENFLEAKLTVSSSRIIQIKELSARNFLTPGQKILLGIFTLGMDHRSCEYGCSASQNVRFKYMVEYQKGSLVCKLPVTVKMISDLLSDKGYKSVVIKRHHPNCQ